MKIRLRRPSPAMAVALLALFLAVGGNVVAYGWGGTRCTPATSRLGVSGRLMSQIVEALGDACTVLNVGAGAGSYEPSDRQVVAVEPSAEMIAQRPPGSAS